jgi:bifunctional DNase/RNase
MPRSPILLIALALGAGACGAGAAAPAPATPAEVAVAPAAATAAEDAPAPEKPRRPLPPTGYVEMGVVAVVPTPNGGAAVLLGEAGKRVVVPIYIGGTEAHSITLRMNEERPERPLTHDLVDSVLRELGGELVKVQVDELRDEVFIGSVFVRREGKLIEIDARPSDAIALAMGSHVPIFVAQQVVDRAGEENPELPHR